MGGSQGRRGRVDSEFSHSQCGSRKHEKRVWLEFGGVWEGGKEEKGRERGGHLESKVFPYGVTILPQCPFSLAQSMPFLFPFCFEDRVRGERRG